MADNINTRQPHECRNIAEVRAEIDNIDREIIRLLATRFGYVREVVKYKDGTAAGIEASDRRKAVIDSRCGWAASLGLNPEVVGSIFNQLIEYFIDEEKKIIASPQPSIVL